jgi:hypothetical protein
MKNFPLGHAIVFVLVSCSIRRARSDSYTASPSRANESVLAWRNLALDDRRHPFDLAG